MSTPSIDCSFSQDHFRPELVVVMDVPFHVFTDHHTVEDAPIMQKSEALSIPTKVGSFIEKIPEELTSNILSRLTPIELVPCKAVCKYWVSLISSPDFVYQHLKRTESDPSSHYLLVSNSYVFDLDTYIPGPFYSVACFSSLDMVIVGSVNGLICISGKTLHSPKSADDIWVLNPATGLSRQLPLPSKSRLTSITKAVLFAFWFDGGVYKVAKLVSVDVGPAVLEVWVSNSPDTWREVTTLDFRFYPSLRFVRDCDVLIEGLGAYWIVSDLDEDIFVLWLDLKTLALKLIPLSDEQKSYLSEGRFEVLAGIRNNVLFGASVCRNFVLVLDSFCYDGTSTFYVWTMWMDGSEFVGWSITDRVILTYGFARCLAWCANGKLVMQSRCNVLTLLDLNTGKVAFLGEDLELEDISVNSGHDFVGSLVSIEGFKRNDLFDLGVGFSWPRDYPCGWGRACKKKMM